VFSRTVGTRLVFLMFIVPNVELIFTTFDVLISAGISAGIDVTLKVVEHCYGEEIARSTAKATRLINSAWSIFYLSCLRSDVSVPCFSITGIGLSPVTGLDMG
jgi:hypothetical protein